MVWIILIYKDKIYGLVILVNFNNETAFNKK